MSVRSAFVMQMLSLRAVSACTHNMADGAAMPARSVADLRQQLEKILADSHTPGLSVAIVRRGGPE
jgi:hypothetical protein